MKITVYVDSEGFQSGGNVRDGSPIIEDFSIKLSDKSQLFYCATDLYIFMNDFVVMSCLLFHQKTMIHGASLEMCSKRCFELITF